MEATESEMFAWQSEQCIPEVTARRTSPGGVRLKHWTEEAGDVDSDIGRLREWHDGSIVVSPPTVAHSIPSGKVNEASSLYATKQDPRWFVRVVLEIIPANNGRVPPEQANAWKQRTGWSSPAVRSTIARAVCANVWGDAKFAALSAWHTVEQEQMRALIRTGTLQHCATALNGALNGASKGASKGIAHASALKRYESMPETYRLFCTIAARPRVWGRGLLSTVTDVRSPTFVKSGHFNLEELLALAHKVHYKINDCCNGTKELVNVQQRLVEDYVLSIREQEVKSQTSPPMSSKIKKNKPIYDEIRGYGFLSLGVVELLTDWNKVFGARVPVRCGIRVYNQQGGRTMVKGENSRHFDVSKSGEKDRICVHFSNRNKFLSFWTSRTNEGEEYRIGNAPICLGTSGWHWMNKEVRTKGYEHSVEEEEKKKEEEEMGENGENGETGETGETGTMRGTEEKGMKEEREEKKEQGLNVYHEAHYDQGVMHDKNGTTCDLTFILTTNVAMTLKDIKMMEPILEKFRLQMDAVFTS